MTTSESATISTLDGGESAVEALGPLARESLQRSSTRYWLLVIIEVLLLATILAIFWCQSRSQMQFDSAPRDFAPPPFGTHVALG